MLCFVFSPPEKDFPHPFTVKPKINNRLVHFHVLIHTSIHHFLLLTWRNKDIRDKKNQGQQRPNPLHALRCKFLLQANPA